MKHPAPIFSVSAPLPLLVERISENFSLWTKFIRIVARLRRLGTNNGSVISMGELRQAELVVWKKVQEEEYGSEIKSLLKKKPSVKKSSSIRRLRPQLKDGLLRVGGRLTHASVSESQTHPIILPAKSPLVRKMVVWTHEIHGHCGQNHLMAILRKKYWIVHGNSVARSVISKCFTCRRLSCKPINQLMADLPADRVCPGDPPFTNTGADCFGPFLVRHGRSRVKRWGAIFTCLTTRAIHLEVLDSMDQDSFVNAIRRFVARRGPVQRIWSDNGSNLIAADRELREALENFEPDEIAQTLSAKGIEWHFNPPHASHFGGVWERLIRSVRRALGATCLQQVTTDDTLLTLFCETESIVNGRPLTKVNDDPDSPAPLTPSMLLTLKGSAGPFTETDKKDLFVRRRWRHAQYLADQFWRRWVREYRPLLQERQKWSERRRDVHVGDIVLTLDERLPRGSWPLGRVVETIQDSDGRVRQAKVKTENGVYLRPVHKMCL